MILFVKVEVLTALRLSSDVLCHYLFEREFPVEIWRVGKVHHIFFEENFLLTCALRKFSYLSCESQNKISCFFGLGYVLVLFCRGVFFSLEHKGYHSDHRGRGFLSAVEFSIFD